ncbi:MAG: outer membrane protein assembly factor BamC [Proteobacteria bacterium]|nr:outer membrane protein assembly factor BamC [Pseudomonadota bacterium]
MKKILLLMIATLLLNGCRYINTQEQYVDAKVSPELAMPEGVDSPNTTSTLNVPKAKAQDGLVEIDSRPPDMPIRTRQSEDQNKRIENVNAYPVLTVKSGKDKVWELMQSLGSENWAITGKEEAQCLIKLSYTDQDAKEREKSGFIKKIFTREKYYTDYSGIFHLNCIEKGSIVEMKFSKQDGSAAKSFLADSIMNKLYDLF